MLCEGQDHRNPLLERVKFLSIYGTNLDEFFQVRVAGLKSQVAVGFTERTADGMTPEQQLQAIAAVVRELQRQHDACLLEEIVPALKEAGVRVLDMDSVTPEEREYLSQYFERSVFPVLTPLAVDPAHPFPYISNLSLSLAVVLRGPDGEERFARVKVPKILPRGCRSRRRTGSSRWNSWSRPTWRPCFPASRSSAPTRSGSPGTPSTRSTMTRPRI